MAERKVFVRGFPSGTTADAVGRVLRCAGPVSDVSLQPGYAFVTFACAACAACAVRTLNGRNVPTWDFAVMTVQFPKTPTKRRLDGGADGSDE